MKKNHSHYGGGVTLVSPQKIFLKMKVTLFVVLFSAIQVLATGAYSQTKGFTLAKENTTLENVLKAIEDQSNYYFLYNGSLIDVSQKINVKLENQSLEATLQALFKDANVTYKIYNRQIVLSPSKTAADVQQSIEVSGQVKDASGVPLPGVTVVIKGTTTGTITDFDGNYSINKVTEGSTLVFSFVGMRSEEVTVENTTTINVILEEDAVGIEEVVAVGYGVQKRGALTGAIASVKSEKITVAPIASTANSLAGRLPGLISKQTSGQPGADGASLSIRGFGDALIIVDGIETDFNNIDPNQIESISILKDGAAAIYGARAGNGVVLVTTKRGSSGKPIITLRSSKTFQTNTKMLKPVNAGQRIELIRESHFNSGGTEADAPYSKEAMEKYYLGTDPLYPNTDWYDELIRKWAPQSQHNLSVRGGSDDIKYYGFIGYLDQETMIKKNGGNYRRYNVQSNIDAQITDALSVQFDIASTFEEKNYSARPMSVDGYLWQDYWTTLPYYHANFPDETKIPYADGGGTGGLHITSNSDIYGYSRTRDKNFRGTLALTYDVKAIKGLKLKAFANYNQGFSSRKRFIKPTVVWDWDPESDIYTEVAKYGGNGILIRNEDNSLVITTQISASYDNVFNDIHRISAVFVQETIDQRNELLYAYREDFLTTKIDYLFGGSTDNLSNNGSVSETGRKSYISRLKYAYEEKYFLEVMMRADASARFPKEHRWGYFPGVSLGWLMSEEGFMKQLDMIDKLKIRGSYGQSGYDNVANFDYLSGYNLGKRYILGNRVDRGLAVTSLANPLLTWEEITIKNIGIDYSLFNQKIFGEFEVFHRYRKGIHATRIVSLPSTFGADLPKENLNEQSDRGFEFSVGSAGRVKELQYEISANVSWSRAKWEKYEEPAYTEPYDLRVRKQTGKWTDVEYGYKTDGLFTSQSQIDDLKYDIDGFGNETLKPGDIIYLDTNNDGVVDVNDKVEIGQGNRPHWMTGLDLNFKYKNIDLSALFQGAFAYNTAVGLEGYSVTAFENRWTESNNDANALVPRYGSTASYPSGLNDFSYKSASYLRLKTFSLGYNLPQNWLRPLNIDKIRFYFAGTNLLTFSQLNKLNIDPEAPNVGRYYPQQKTVSFGLEISL